MLKSPHLQGLLQQLRISTPSLGAQVPSVLRLWLQTYTDITDNPSLMLQVF